MDVGHRHLVRPPESLNAVAVDLARAGPPFRAAQDDHRPAWSLDGPFPGTPRLLLDGADLLDASFQGGRGGLVHAVEVGALDEVRCVTVALEQRLEFLMADAGEEGW